MVWWAASRTRRSLSTLAVQTLFWWSLGPVVLRMWPRASTISLVVEDDVLFPKPNREAADDDVGRWWLLWLSQL
ncbi:hypothetical protein M0R45_005905 [Rubus argutus]|uniref:Secreted protein n=1 Tax=Rubus argutus TaxID=59490 RepID=A0AAW1YNW5_RUBAR